MFSYILFLALLNVLKYSRSEDCVLNTATRQDAWDKVLHRDKTRTYRFTQPPRNQSCVPVKVRFQLKSFALDEYEGKFTAKVWTRTYWNDERLTWKPEEYGGIDKMIVDNSEIWAPSLKLLNSIDPDLYSLEFGECQVKYTGEVICVPQLVYESYCSAELSDWPYDVQNCTLEFGNGEKFDNTRFKFAGKGMVLFPAEYGNGWNIMAMYTKEDPDSDIQLSITLTMERQAYGLVVILVVPCLILCTLTSTSILMNLNDYLRLGLSCFSLMSHFVFLTAISGFLPKHSADTPVIIFFIRSSIVLTLTSVVFTYLLTRIVKRKTAPFEWVSVVCSKVFDSYGQYVIVPRWNVDIDDVNLKNKEIWNNLANILNSVYMVIVVIVYICLFSAYMPKQPPAEY